MSGIVTVMRIASGPSRLGRARTAAAALLALTAVGLAGCDASGSGTGGDPGLGNGLGRGTGIGTGNSSRASSAAAPDTPRGISVVAGENTWGDIAAQLGGPGVTVTSIIDKPGEDPHEYESTLSDADAVAHARVIIENGAGYDDFLGRLVGASHPSGRVVINIARTLGVGGGNPNPHFWYQPQYVLTAADEIARELTAIAPDQAAVFAANLRAFRSGEQQVLDVIAQIRSRFGGTEVGYTERLPGYLLDAAGLKQGTPSGFAQAIEDGDDPNPIDNARFEDEISAHRMKVLVYNAQVGDAITNHLRKYATTHGVRVVGMAETLPPGAGDFQQWQAAQARALLAALDG